MRSRDECSERKSDLDKIQGTWEVAAADPLGKFVYEKGATLVIASDKWSLSKGGEWEKCKIKLDPTKNPKTMDLILGDTIIRRGIYVHDGDTLKICIAFGHDTRPGDFKATQKDVVVTFKRVKQ